MTVSQESQNSATVRETARAAATDLADLAALVPADGTAAVADKLSEECAELAQMIRSLPGRPAEGLSGSDAQILSGLRTAHAAGEDIAETIARACARLAHELGSVYAPLSNREGSWEAAILAQLIRGTVGEGGEGLDLYRVTQP
jgi:hypothetical protein